MGRVARSIFVFGIYLVTLGLILMVIPNVLLSVFGLPNTNEVWIRVLGLVVVVTGYFYILAGYHDLTPFHRWTLYDRPLVPVVFTVFVLLGFVKPILILFGIIDLLGAIWTWLEMRASST